MPGRDTDFEPLIDAHWAQVLKLATRLTGNLHEGEEVTQQAFFLAYRAWPKFEGRSQPLTWLMRIAINACKAHVLKRQRTSALPLDEATPPSVHDRDHLEDREQSERVERALLQISPKHRTVLTLFCLDGLSHEAVAEILGCPVGTVWSRLHSARAALAQQLTIAQQLTLAQQLTIAQQLKAAQQLKGEGPR